MDVEFRKNTTVVKETYVSKQPNPRHVVKNVAQKIPSGRNADF